MGKARSDIIGHGTTIIRYLVFLNINTACCKKAKNKKFKYMYSNTDKIKKT